MMIQNIQLQSLVTEIEYKSEIQDVRNIRFSIVVQLQTFNWI